MNETINMSGQLAIDSDNDNDNAGNILENSNFLSSLGNGAAQTLVNKILNGTSNNDNNSSSDTTSNLLATLTATLANSSKNSYDIPSLETSTDKTMDKPNSSKPEQKDYEVKIERIQADGHLNDRTIRKYRALAIEFEEFLDIVSDDGKRSWREVFTENIHTMTSSNDPVKYDAAQNSMRKVLTGYLANLKAPDGRSYGASSYCVRRSAIRWYVEREYGYEMSRTRGWNNIFKVVHTIKNSGNSSSYSQPTQSKKGKSNDSSSNFSTSNSSTLTNLTLLPTTTTQPVILNPSQFSTSFMPYITQKSKTTPTIVRSSSPKSITLASPKTITLNPISTHSSATVSPVTQITQVTHGFLEEDLHRVYDLFYSKSGASVMNNPVLACSYIYFQLSAHFTRYLDFPIDESLKIKELCRDSNGLSLNPSLLAQFKSKIEDEKNASQWSSIPIITDKIFLAVYDQFLLKRQESLPNHPDYRDPGKLFLLPIGASFAQNSEDTSIKQVFSLDNDQRWFTCCPHSKSSVFQIVPGLCKLAKLSKHYTNASLKYLPKNIDLDEISQNYSLEFYDRIKKKATDILYSEKLKVEKVLIKSESVECESPPLKKAKISEIPSSNNSDVLIRQVLVNQQTIMSNQANLETGMKNIVERIENIEKQLPRLKVQQRRRAVMCRRGVVTIRWHQMVPKKKKRKIQKN